MKETIEKETIFDNISITKKIKIILHFITKILLYSIFTILIIFALAIIIYFIDLEKNIKSGKYTNPIFNAYVIISPSMVPAIKVQDAVVVMRTEAKKLKLNDIITFDSKDTRYSGLTITHRIVGIENPNSDNILFRTKGDNNYSEDSALVKGEEIYGKVILKIPKIGYLQYFLSKSYGWIIIIVLPCLGIIIYDIIKIIKSFRKGNNDKGNNENINDTKKKKIKKEKHHLFAKKRKTENIETENIELIEVRENNVEKEHENMNNDEEII